MDLSGWKRGVGRHIYKAFALVITLALLCTAVVKPIPVQAADVYAIPAGVGKDLQPALQSKITSSMGLILKRVETDMTAAMEPLIPQMTSMVSSKTSQMGPKINQVGIATIEPSLKVHVEEQAQIIAEEVNRIIMSAMAGAGPRSDPTSLIRSSLSSAIPRLKQEALVRAEQEQLKDMQAVNPQIEAIVQENMNVLIPEIQNIVLPKLKEQVPATQKAVDAEIDAMIAELQASLPDDQKKLMVEMRPQFEAKTRPHISEELFDAVAAKLDQKVISSVEASTKESIKAIVTPMNKYCTDFAASYAKSLLPPQVDEMGIRAEIEKLIDESASENVNVFEERITANNEVMFKKQADIINQQMHTFVKDQTMALLNGGSAATTVLPVTPVPVAPVTPVVPNLANSANVTLNGRQLSFDVPPVVVEGRTLVPLAVIFNALGATVNWDANTHVVTAQKGSVEIALQAGQKQVSKNGQPIILDVPAMIVDGRTMVPISFVSQSFGATVNWDGNTRTVSIEAK
ncbi:MAG: hypothetical protein CVU90_06915 [Firmicutes bacterium HGW-Firmicutes-15]|nr:MAG: hypothetical protein CVU90_06915 [Firmicutes bacterium HGW-Firmicutes-15]